MKKILTIAVLGATLAGFTACDSFLDEEPRSEMTSVAFNQTAAQMIGQVNCKHSVNHVANFVN